jgi:hypothetical protein
MLVEAWAVAAAEAVLRRLAGSGASVLVAGVQDKRALEAALKAAMSRTGVVHGSVLARYDVNVGFL